MAENIYKKGARLFKEGRVVLIHAGKRGLTFEVKGDTEFYTVKVWEDGRITCTCKYSSLYPDRLCSHKVAIMIYLYEKKQFKTEHRS